MTSGFPVVRSAPHDSQLPFPLTDTQVAYVLGREDAFEFGGVAAHGYYEYEGAVDPVRFTAAWNQLVDRHDALRLVVDTEKHQQRVLASVPWFEPTIHDLQGLPESARNERLDELREQYSHWVADPGQWPLFHIAISLIDARTVRLHIGFDGLCFDYLSWRLLLSELTLLYRDPAGPLPELTLTFRDYILALAEFEDTDLYRRSERYWLERVSTFPTAPQLPYGAQRPDTTRFVRREADLAPDRWGRLTSRARAHGLTPSALMMAVFAEVIAVWSAEDRFALNVPSMNRMPLHPQVEAVVGEFASLCAVEIQHDRHDSFLSRAQSIQASLWDVLEHSHYSALRFMRELARHDRAPERSRMPIVLTSTLGWSEGARTPFDGAVSEVYALSQTPQVSLDVQIHEQDGELYYNWDTVDSAFAPGVIDAMFTAFDRLLQRLADSAELWLHSDMELVSDRAAEITGPQQEPGAALLPDLFVRRARAQPNHPALIDGPHSINYAELLDSASRIANHLREMATARTDQPIVVVALDKGWRQFAAVYGVMLAGAAYLPLDTAAPSHRQRTILDDAGTTIVLTDTTTPRAVLDVLGDRPELTIIDIEGAAVRAADPNPPNVDINTHDLVYVLYTSGSSGIPKGVMVEHGGVLNCVADTIASFDIGTGDISLSVSALHHDMSGFDVFVVLAAGATVVVTAGEGRRNPAHWRQLVAEHGVTLWCSVPAMVDMLHAEGGTALTSPRLVFSGGDRISPALVDRLAAACPNAQFVSIGGPTETTLWNIWFPVEASTHDLRSIPYGRPIANTRYCLLDHAGRPVPKGVVGEMYCAGPGVARGYLGRCELTDDVFVTLPDSGERAYRTGDFGRLGSEGAIEFVGRRDRQVKLRGHRIELGEVETVLGTVLGVDEAAVTVSSAGNGDDRHALVAHITGSGTVHADHLRRTAAQLLPAHMVPTVFHHVDALPLTANGKVDYRALAASATAVPVQTGPLRSATALDAVLADIWCGVLDVPAIGPDDNFYALGGNSVVAVAVTREMREVLDDPTIDLHLLLNTRTLGELARNLVARETDPQRLDRVARTYLEILELSNDAVESELAGHANEQGQGR